MEVKMNRSLFVFLFVGILYSASFSFTDTNDTLSKIKDCDSLQKQLNMINAKLDKILVEISDDGFQATRKRELKTWGRGWNIGADLTTEMTGLEGGYTFKTQNGTFYGTYLGFQGGIRRGTPNSLGYLRLMAGTPIFLSSVSVQISMVPTCYFDKGSFFGGLNSWWGFGLNPQVAFWLSPKSCLTLGIKGTLSDRTQITEADALKGAYTWYEINLGYTYTIKKI
jgi:hypothetical protein